MTDPQRLEEMLVAIVVVFLQIVLEAGAYAPPLVSSI